MDAEHWQQRVEELANQWQRVLAVACKPVHAHQQELDFNDVEEGLVLLGLFGIIDPPRAEAIAAVAEYPTAGIRVKMITGDHAGTARDVDVYARVSPEDKLRLVTLSADLDGRVLKVHVLDGLGDCMPELEALEQRVRRM